MISARKARTTIRPLLLSPYMVRFLVFGLKAKGRLRNWARPLPISRSNGEKESQQRNCTEWPRRPRWVGPSPRVRAAPAWIRRAASVRGAGVACGIPAGRETTRSRNGSISCFCCKSPSAEGSCCWPAMSVLAAGSGAAPESPKVSRAQGAGLGQTCARSSTAAKSRWASQSEGRFRNVKETGMRGGLARAAWRAVQGGGSCTCLIICPVEAVTVSEAWSTPRKQHG